MPPRLLRLRLVARLIDLIVVAVPIGIGGLVVTRRSASAEGVDGLVDGLFYLFLSAFWLLVCWPVYEAVGYRTSGSIGKRIMGLRMASAQVGRPSWADALWRGMLVAWPLTLGVVLYGVPSVAYAGWLCWDASRDPLGRHWVDRVTGSIVLPRDAQVFDLTR